MLVAQAEHVAKVVKNGVLTVVITPSGAQIQPHDCLTLEILSRFGVILCVPLIVHVVVGGEIHAKRKITRPMPYSR